MSFWLKVDQSAGDQGCWPWLGEVNPKGYGRYYEAGRRYQAHRYAYDDAIGLIPDGLVLDHLCRNRRCCNPSHLEPVTQRENVLRGRTLPAALASQTQCKRGHPLSGDNLGVWGGSRRCLTCNRARQHRAYWSDPEKARAEDRAAYRKARIDALREDADA